MRNVFTRIALLVIGLLATLASSAADPVKIDGIYYSINFQDKTAEVTNRYGGYYEGNHQEDYSGDVLIPKEVMYSGMIYTVTSIGDYAFWGCNSLTSVIFPESLISIGKEAFCGCIGLTSLTFPKSLTEIKERAFYDVHRVERMEFYCNELHLGNNAFATGSPINFVLIDCKNLSYDDPFGVYGYYNQDNLIKTLIIGPKVQSIQGYGYLQSDKTIWLGNTPPDGVSCISSYIN